MKFLIIGNGVAGIEAALTLRKNDQDAEIKIITKSSYSHYYRPNTIEYLAEYKKISKAKDKLFTYKENFLKDKNIQQILNLKIVDIAPDKKTVYADNSETFHYDRLLLATGGNSFKPPIPGSDLKGVFTLHGINDAEQIIDYLESKNATKITIIGGGLLGLETANSLNNRGLEVTVIEIADRLLPRQLDAQGASLLQKKLQAKGISFIINEKINSISGTDVTEKIVLHSGKEHLTDAVIISAGIRPDLTLAKKTGLENNRGLIINQRMETSFQEIYAAGDVIEFNEHCFGLWIAAKEQGRIAALNMLNQEEQYTGTTLAATLKIKDVELFSAGDINNENLEIFLVKNNSNYIKLSLENKTAQGIIVLGNKDAVKDARKVMKNSDYIDNFISQYKLEKN